MRAKNVIEVKTEKLNRNLERSCKMSDRSNNGVRSKVTHDAGRGSIERGEGRAGRDGDEGGLKPVGGEVGYKGLASNDMTAITGSKGSSGTEKGMGGIEIKGDEEHRDFFKDEH